MTKGYINLFYDKIFITLFISILSLVANSQIRFKSNVCRIQTRQNITDKWQDQDFTQFHLIVFDTTDKKISVYTDTKENELDIISNPKKDIKGTSEEYTWNCVDIKNIECSATFSWLDNRPFFFRINYNNYRLWIFIDKQ